MDKFIEILSERFYSENDLSDITYTLLICSKDFFDIFIKTIFPDFDITSRISIERESFNNNCRPDFTISTCNHKCKKMEYEYTFSTIHYKLS